MTLVLQVCAFLEPFSFSLSDNELSLRMQINLALEIEISRCGK